MSTERASSTATVADEQFTARTAGACAVVGAVGYLAVSLAHGDLPSDTVEQALAHVARQPSWNLIHLGGIVSILLWAAAIAGLAQLMPLGRPSTYGRLATIAAAIGAALYTVDYSIDGLALKAAADAWAAASGPDALTHREPASAILAVLQGTVTAATTWTFGLPILLTGLAVHAAGRFSRALAWPPIITGSLGLLGGLGTYLHPAGEVAFLVTLASSGFTALWLIALGVTLWRWPASGRS